MVGKQLAQMCRGAHALSLSNDPSSMQTRFYYTHLLIKKKG